MEYELQFCDGFITSIHLFSTAALPSYRSLQAPRNMTREEERGVHGGLHATRPNMQESMVFLRKLFSHQKQEGANTSYSNLISPPDSPLRTFLSGCLGFSMLFTNS